MLAFSIISITNLLVIELSPLAYLLYLYMENLKTCIVPCDPFLCQCGISFTYKIISAHVLMFVSTNVLILHFIGIIPEEYILALIKLSLRKYKMVGFAYMCIDYINRNGPRYP